MGGRAGRHTPVAVTRLPGPQLALWPRARGCRGARAAGDAAVCPPPRRLPGQASASRWCGQVGTDGAGDPLRATAPAWYQKKPKSRHGWVRVGRGRVAVGVPGDTGCLVPMGKLRHGAGWSVAGLPGHHSPGQQSRQGGCRSNVLTGRHGLGAPERGRRPRQGGLCHPEAGRAAGSAVVGRLPVPGWRVPRRSRAGSDPGRRWALVLDAG